MKKFINILGLFIVLGITFSACSEDPLYTEPTPTPIKVTSIAVVGLDANVLTLQKATTHQIKIAFVPTNATDISKYAFTYKSADTKIATVSSTGVVTAVATGEAVITVTPTNNTKLEKTFKVVVPESFISVTSVEIAPTALKEVKIGETIPLATDITVKPANASNKVVTYTSSDVTKATVHANSGVVTGVAAGEVTITIASVEKPAISTTHKVTVKAVPVETITVTGLGIVANKVDLDIAKTLALTTTVLPATATDKTVTYTSSAPTIATVDATTGLITAVKEGTATITVASKSTPTVKQEIVVTVKAAAVIPVESVTVTNTEIVANKVDLEVLKTLALTPAVLPATATQAVTYTSATPAVATVSATGVITAVAEGTSIITVASVADVTKKYDLTVTVKPVAAGGVVWVADAIRKGWEISTSHPYLSPESKEAEIVGTPESMLDNDEGTVLILVKPGKRYPNAEGLFPVDLTGEPNAIVYFSANLKAVTEFDHIFISPRNEKGVSGMFLKTVKLEGSANGTDWTTMEDVAIPVTIIPASSPTPALNSSVPVKLSKAYSYQYVKVTYIDYHSATGGSTAQVAEFKLGLEK